LKSDENLESFFEIERIVKWIADNGFKRTALQLPDGFLAYAYRLSSTIEGKCKDTKIYILADTSYRRFVLSLNTLKLLLVAVLMTLQLNMPTVTV
jgi:diphthamide synthase subunit DPH2